MSLKTWKKEFYPIPANKVKKSDALDHSIKKWEGLTKSNLEKHHVTFYSDFSGHGIIARNGDCLAVNGYTCALCSKYDDNDCFNCPLCIYLGSPCDNLPGSPYKIFANTKNPLPMINALKKAKELNNESNKHIDRPAKRKRTAKKAA